MTKDEYRKVINEIVYLSGCVINDIVPDEKKFKDIDLDALYKIAEKHFLTAITGLALEKVGIYDNKFVQAKAKSVRKIAAMEIYKKQLFDKLEDEIFANCELLFICDQKREKVVKNIIENKIKENFYILMLILV